MRDPLNLSFPIRLFHGTADEDVKMDVPLKLIKHINSPDVELVIVKDADHRFSSVKCLELISNAIDSITNQ